MRRFDLVLSRFNEVFVSRNSRKYKTFTITLRVFCRIPVLRTRFRVSACSKAHAWVSDVPTPSARAASWALQTAG